MPKLPSFRAGAASAATLGVVLTAVTALVFGYELALLVLSTAVLLLVIVLFWSSVRNLGGDTPLSLDEAISMGAPTAAEEQKRAVLRALKDLEFERSVGKISEQDYLDFSARYRAEARALITAADVSSAPAHDLAEKLAAEHLARAGLAAPGSKATSDAVASEPALESEGDPLAEPEPNATSPVKANGGEPSRVKREDEAAPSAAPSHDCPDCATRNDLDARFCKRCGAELIPGPRGEVAAKDEPAREKLS